MSMKPEARRKLGYTLMLLGILPFVALMITTVIIRQPPIGMVIATVGCWVLFFIGKTMIKTPERRSTYESGEPESPAP